MKSKIILDKTAIENFINSTLKAAKACVDNGHYSSAAELQLQAEGVIKMLALQGYKI